MAKTNNQDEKVDGSNLIIVLPGDNVTKHIIVESNADEASTPSSSRKENRQKQPKLGTGLRYDTTTHQVYATCPGRLECRANNKVYFVQQNIQKRYRPSLEDRVVGIIEERAGSDGVGGDLYRVNINASHPAILSSLSFEGASKRNKPNFHPGQVLYARIISALEKTKNQADPLLCFDPITLSCINGPHDGNLPRKDWMTSEGAYGELRGGTVCQVSTGLARELLRIDNIVLTELSRNKNLQFEIAVGVNGLVWIHSTRPEYTIMIQNAIQNSSVLTPEQVRGMVQSLTYTVEKQLQQDRDAES